MVNKKVIPFLSADDRDSNYPCMLFDLHVEGHHSSYIRYIVEYWIKTNRKNSLIVVVTPTFLDLHKKLVRNSAATSQGSVKLISNAEEKSVNLEKSIVSRAFKEWNIFCTYAESLSVTSGLLMYFDYFQIPLIFGRKSPCLVSGIYFRPTLHYRYLCPEKFSLKIYLKDWVKKKILYFSLSHSKLSNLFSLDEFSVEYIKDLNLNTRTNIQYLPDPVTPHQVNQEKVARLKEKLSIKPGRHIFLLFGSLGKGKGIYQVLEAIKKLDDKISSSVCLLCIGKLSGAERERFKGQAAKISGLSNIQIVIHDDFVPDEEVQLYFDISHTILIPYQRHVGMSGVLLHSASAMKPVISSQYGLLGKLVQTYKLGTALNSSNPQEISKQIQFYVENNIVALTDTDQVSSFLNKHSPFQFSEIVVNQIDPL